MSPVQGEYYIITSESRSERDDRAYTPFFNLVAGREYNISFYTHFDGYIVNGQPRTATMNFTVGTEQEADFHPVTLTSISRALDIAPAWVRETVQFTPTGSGPYCFAFMLEGPAVSGWVAVDLFEINSAYDLPRPKPEFSLGGNYNYTDNNLLAFGDHPVPAFNLFQFEERPERSGTVYLTFEFSDQLEIDVEDPNIGRSFFSLQMVRSRKPDATFYAKSSVNLEDKGILAGEWHRVYDYTPDNSGLGLNMILKADYLPATDGIDGRRLLDVRTEGATAKFVK